MKKPLVIGYRGAKGHIAENIIPSILKALSYKVDTIISDFPDRI